jgi:para-nitrobenzyl esterase
MSQRHLLMSVPAIVAVGAAGFMTLVAAASPVKTRGGQLTGVPGRDPAVTVFKGIPYAAPPVGELRWVPPRPAAQWHDVRRADTFGPNCTQSIVQERKPWTFEFMAHGAVSEDCLYLNVWTPARAGGRRPVFVWIYGGGFSEGSGSVPVYDGEGLAKKGLVVVTFNYRVGAFGFLAHPELTKESSLHASGNYGLLDQVAALQWVRDNIAAFGGDPGRVTIAGQSAGGMSVEALIASPLAKGLFHRAIDESGGALAGVNAPARAEAEREGLRFAEAKRAGSLADLRAMTAEQIAAPIAVAARFRFSPIVDGYVLTAPVGEIVASGRHNDVPTIAGATANDLGNATTEQRRETLYNWAVARGRTSKTFAYLFLFAHAMPGPDVERYGAFHTADVPYAFNTLYMSDRPFTEVDHRIAELMSAYWANFAASGNPNGKGLPPWPAASGARAEIMHIGAETKAFPVSVN